MSARLSAIKSVPLNDLVLVAISYVYPDDEGIMNVDVDVLVPQLRADASFAEFNYRCDCCGSTRLRYACEVVHTPTNQGYYVGRTCAAKIESLQSFDGHIEQASIALLERARTKSRRAAWMKTRSEDDVAIMAWAGAQPSGSIAHDIYGKLGQYGSISEKQLELVYNLKAQGERRAAEKAAEPKPTAPAPEGRAEVDVVLLGTKLQDNMFGQTLKCICRVKATGAKIWFTLPKGLSTERNQEFTVRATFKRSDNDPFFAFGARPHLVAKASAVGDDQDVTSAAVAANLEDPASATSPTEGTVAADAAVSSTATSTAAN